MIDHFDLARVRKRLEGRFGIALESSHESVDGGEFDVIRPMDLERGNGFGIVLSRTHRQVEASFRADNFAGSLLRKMAESDVKAHALFDGMLALAKTAGMHVFIAVNGMQVSGIDTLERVWRTFQIDVTRRIPSGKLQPQTIVELGTDAASFCLGLALSLLALEELREVSDSGSYGLPEGAVTRIEVNRYERSPVNRAACIAHFGTACQTCGFDFSRFYGPDGDGYIEVHHITPVSVLGPDYLIDPVKDLIPVCSNCHSILHRTNPPMSIDILRKILHMKVLMLPAVVSDASIDNAAFYNENIKTEF